MPPKICFIKFLKLFLLIISIQFLLMYIRNYRKHQNAFYSWQNGKIPLDTETFDKENLTKREFSIEHIQNASIGSWQNVGNMTAYKFLVYSAYLDIRNGKNLKIIAATILRKRKKPVPNVWCKLWYNFVSKTVPGKLSIIKEHWNLPYSAYYITCPLEDSKATPEAVSLLSESEESPKNLLKVIKNKEDQWNPETLSPNISQMAVCVKPMHYDYDKIFELLEFIELHRIMSVDHFYFYNHSVSAQIDCILRKYAQEGLVTVLPWQLPIISQKEIRTEGIFASLNDCLFRTMHKYSHAIFIDFDEYIIPGNDYYSYKDLFEYLLKSKQNRKKSCFSFKNAFFYRQWPDDEDIKRFPDPLAKNLITLRKTRRKTDLHPHKQRSKFIVRPELVNMVGNHFIWDYYDKNKYGTLDVNPNDSFMHHYRVCEFGGDDCINQKSVVDKTAYKYKNELIKAVRLRYDAYAKECNLDNI